MAFDLEITITGLCVFVPDPAQKQVHVLMVEPGPHHGAAHRHYPRLFYDAAHDSSAKPKKFWRVVPLDRTVLDLSGVGGGGKYGGKLSDIKNLVDISQDVQPMPKPADTPKDGLSCLVTLPLATKKIESPNAKGKWELRGKKGTKTMDEAAWLIEWIVEGSAGSDLALQLQAFTGETIPTFPRQPLNSIEDGNRQVIRIHLSNVVLRESAPPNMLLQPFPESQGKMPHFDAYRDFYKQAGSTTDPWPELVYTGPVFSETGRGRGTQYSCLPSGGK
ncbi:MAG: hypothetical protein ACREOC_07415 [Gemmatimonadales bacterium]